LVLRISRSPFGYTYVEGSPEEIVSLLKLIQDEWSRDTDDLDDAIRIISNFEVFYEMMRKKFKEYISPRKREGDLIRGLVVVDKIKLMKSGDARIVTVIFDKRVNHYELEHLVRKLNTSLEDKR